MSRLSRLLRAVAALGLALPLVVVANSPAAAASTLTRFFADHTRNCAYSHTRGTLDWNPSTLGGTPQVRLVGLLADQPAALCSRPQAGTPFATFTAYVDGRKVDEETVSLQAPVTADEPVREFAFNLSAAGLPAPVIDQVDVQVCRDFGPMLPAVTCGERQSYHRARIGPVG